MSTNGQAVPMRRLSGWIATSDGKTRAPIPKTQEEKKLHGEALMSAFHTVNPKAKPNDVKSMEQIAKIMWEPPSPIKFIQEPPVTAKVRRTRLKNQRRRERKRAMKLQDD